MSIATLAAQAILAALEIYRQQAGKPKEWVPTKADWQRMREWAKRTPEQIKAEAREALRGA